MKKADPSTNRLEKYMFIACLKIFFKLVMTEELQNILRAQLTLKKYSETAKILRYLFFRRFCRGQFLVTFVTGEQILQ